MVKAYGRWVVLDGWRFVDHPLWFRLKYLAGMPAVPIASFPAPSATLVLKILTGFVMIGAIVFPAATTNVIGQVFPGFGINVAHKGFVPVITSRAMVAG